MAILPANSARVSNQLRMTLGQRNLSRTQGRLLEVQNQLATGKRISTPSDAPTDASMAMQLRKLIEQRQSYATNLSAASSTLSEVDSTLENVTEILREAQQIASANAGSVVSADARATAATMVENIYSSMMTLANRQHQGTYLFSGDRGTIAPYQPTLGGMRFAGSPTVIQNQMDEVSALNLSVSGPDIFGASATIAGLDLAPVTPPLTPLTAVADLNGGSGISLAGLVITNGATTANIDFTGVTTVEGILNKINGANVGAFARISADGTAIEVTNAVQGTKLSIGENGGTTAAELGVRTLSPASLLSGLNGGVGVRQVAGADLQFTRSDGTTFQVDLAGAATVQDVIDAINAAGGAGFAASFATTGSGIVITDTLGGGGQPSVSSINFSLAAQDLGLDVAAAGGVITGRDVSQLEAGGVFATLAALRDALLHNDSAAITKAGESLQGDLDRVVRVRGQAGALLQEVERRQERFEEQNVATLSLLSGIEDTDYDEAITKFQTLQTALQAHLQTSAQVLNLSLLDFLQ
jgi:flagellin-like hook-associated protein FlgL